MKSPQSHRFPHSKATPNKLPVSRPLLKYICMRAGGLFPLFHYCFKLNRSHLMQPFEYYLSPPILQSSLLRVFSHVIGNNSPRNNPWRCCVVKFTSAYYILPEYRRKTINNGRFTEIMEFLVLTGNRCGRWMGNRKFIWSGLINLHRLIMLYNWGSLPLN